MKFIINADDCGISNHVNLKIEEYIKNGYISSTTIMANMPAVEQAKELYDHYHDTISFGIHLNLTQGQPMVYNQMLLDKEIYKTDDQGNLVFNNKISSSNEMYNKEIRNAIYNELCAQIDKIMELGINYSHIDSHHHVHTRPFMLRIIPKLQKKYGFNKIRRMRNYMPFSASRIGREMWWQLLKLSTKRMISTDYFTSYISFIESTKDNSLIQGNVIELMVHPGGYENDIELDIIKNNNLRELFNTDIINYNQL